MKWQPISTAPKDGTIVDLWHNRYGRITDTWWDDNHWIALSIDDQEFTHWMLVPEPPNCIEERRDKWLLYQELERQMK